MTPQPAFRSRGLSRQFGDRTAVSPLDLDIAAGGVVGLVGPNGSGKSTLIRMLLGLLRPTGGEAWVLGEPLSRPERYLPRVGALVESPAFVPALSARSNLTSLAHLRGVDAVAVTRALERVGLAARDAEPVKRFSLGMKQRLGIAAALLNDPELLVLDEPTNGLDPAGIVEIRSLLRDLGSEGRTVLVSSHLLSEIEAACDQLVIIRFGELLYAGSTDQLVARGSTSILMTPEHHTELHSLVELVTRLGWESALEEASVRVLGAGEADAAALNRAAHAAGLSLRLLLPERQTLEQVFLDMTGSVAGEALPAA